MAAVLEEHMQGRQFVVGDSVTVADFVLAYTLDWGNEDKLLDDCPQLLAYMKRMYARPKAPARIAEAFAAISWNKIPQVRSIGEVANRRLCLVKRDEQRWRFTSCSA